MNDPMGTRYGADVGDPLSHEGSALDWFLAERLGIDGGKRSLFGMYAASPVEALRDPTEPRWRYYDGIAWTPRGLDEKRPDCVFQPTQSPVCRLDAWLAGDQRFDYLGTNDAPTTVATGFARWGDAAGSGFIAAEAWTYLEFAKRYNIGGFNGGAYATPRSWTVNLIHTGSLPGSATSNAWQYAFRKLELELDGSDPVLCPNGDECAEGSACWRVLGVPGLEDGSRVCVIKGDWFASSPSDADGVMVLDVPDVDLERYACDLPNGITLIQSFNQAQGRTCFVEEGKPEEDRRYTCDSGHFARVRGRLTHALCRVDWDAVMERIAETPGGFP